jgi:hypothetical protein
VPTDCGSSFDKALVFTGPPADNAEGSGEMRLTQENRPLLASAALFVEPLMTGIETFSAALAMPRPWGAFVKALELDSIGSRLYLLMLRRPPRAMGTTRD